MRGGTAHRAPAGARWARRRAGRRCGRRVFRIQVVRKNNVNRHGCNLQFPKVAIFRRPGELFQARTHGPSPKKSHGFASRPRDRFAIIEIARFVRPLGGRCPLVSSVWVAGAASPRRLATARDATGLKPQPPAVRIRRQNGRSPGRQRPEMPHDSPRGQARPAEKRVEMAWLQPPFLVVAILRRPGELQPQASRPWPAAQANARATWSPMALRPGLATGLPLSRLRL